MRRFLLDTDIPAGELVVSGNLFRHMAKVLRLKIGTTVILVDRKGAQHAGMIRDIKKDSLIVSVERMSEPRFCETGPRITLYQGLPKADKMEFILQKTTELGISDIIPFAAARSVPRLTKEREKERLARWQRIGLEAARQCERTIPPRISPVKSFPEILDEPVADSVKLILWEKEQSTRLKAVFSEKPSPAHISVIVGPEGGLTTEEATTAMEAGFIPVTLGSRILRTETAAIAIVAIVQFFWGDIG